MMFLDYPLMALVVAWIILCVSSVGALGIHLLLMMRAARRPWRLNIEKSFRPEISLIVPTYNESDLIRFKLENLIRVDYPNDKIQIIVADSNSTDGTMDIVRDFAERHRNVQIELMSETERKGKVIALNAALKDCSGDIVIVSDADCFWPSNILLETIPFFSDLRIGAISGPKLLLNVGESWTASMEGNYLGLMSRAALGQSKVGSTILFEGGFSAYRKDILDSFDPYGTGSDDCGTIIKLAEKNYKAILIPEAKFYSAFPTTWKEKARMKIRRANQLVRVLGKYLELLLKGRIKYSRSIITQGIYIYLITPFIFVAFGIATFYLFWKAPYSVALLAIFVIPKIRVYALEAVQSYIVLILSIFSVILKRKFVIWTKPNDRSLVREDILRSKGLI